MSHSSQIEENNVNGNAFFSTAPINTGTDNEQIGSPPWSQLPDRVVENIYSFLSRKDQKSMSLVCSNWFKEFSCPSLWRKVTFCVPDREYLTAEMCPDVTYAWRYGAMFHHVEIVLTNDCFAECERPYTTTIWSQIKSFLRALTRLSKLVSISFKNMIYVASLVPEAISAEIYAAILNMIKSQRKLEFIEFSDSFFKNSIGGEILSAILLNTSDTLRYLHLHNFLDESFLYAFTNVAVSEDLNFQIFMNLRKLTIDYCPVFENMLLSFYEYRRKVDMRGRTGCLEEIRIHYVYLEYPGIHSDVWKYFSKTFPGLSVDLYFYFECDYSLLSSFIVPHLPLRGVDFWFKQIDDLILAFGIIISSGINNSLEAMKLVVTEHPLNISTNLINLTNVCPMLKTLKLHCYHPLEGIDNLLNSWLVDKPVSLDSFTLIISHVSAEEFKAAYTSLNDFYAPLLQPLGLNLNIIDIHARRQR